MKKSFFEIQMEYFENLHMVNQKRIADGLPIIRRTKSDMLEKDKPSVKDTNKSIMELNMPPFGKKR